MKFFLKPEFLRFIKFCAVGGSGVVVNYAIFLTCYSALLLFLPHGWRYNVAAIIGYIISVATNFLLNAMWTFKDREEKEARTLTLKKFVMYFLSSLVAFFVQLGVLNLLTQSFHIDPRISNLIGILVGTLSNFVLNNYWTFAKKSKNGELGI